MSAVITDPPVRRLLARLDGVKELAPDRWVTRCPAHADKHPSLSIRETDGGTLLVKCWAGCGAADVMGAVGLALSDLFPKPLPDRGPVRKSERWVPNDVWACVSFEAAVVAQAAADVATGRELSPADVQRVAVAAIRLDDAVAVMGAIR